MTLLALIALLVLLSTAWAVAGDLEGLFAPVSLTTAGGGVAVLVSALPGGNVERPVSGLCVSKAGGAPSSTAPKRPWMGGGDCEQPLSHRHPLAADHFVSTTCMAAGVVTFSVHR